MGREEGKQKGKCMGNLGRGGYGGDQKSIGGGGGEAGVGPCTPVTERKKRKPTMKSRGRPTSRKMQTDKARSEKSKRRIRQLIETADGKNKRKRQGNNTNNEKD
jgi:hypothetical protein